MCLGFNGKCRCSKCAHLFNVEEGKLAYKGTARLRDLETGDSYDAIVTSIAVQALTNMSAASKWEFRVFGQERTEMYAVIHVSLSHYAKQYTSPH